MPEQNSGSVNNKEGEGEREEGERGVGGENDCQVYVICLKKKHSFYPTLHSSL